jgi:hypothetical protein
MFLNIETGWRYVGRLTSRSPYTRSSSPWEDLDREESERQPDWTIYKSEYFLLLPEAEAEYFGLPARSLVSVLSKICRS